MADKIKLDIKALQNFVSPYYHRINKHLIGSTRVLEYDDLLDVIREIDGGEW